MEALTYSVAIVLLSVHAWSERSLLNKFLLRCNVSEVRCRVAGLFTTSCTPEEQLQIQCMLEQLRLKYLVWMFRAVLAVLPPIIVSNLAGMFHDHGVLQVLLAFYIIFFLVKSRLALASPSCVNFFVVVLHLITLWRHVTLSNGASFVFNMPCRVLVRAGLGVLNLNMRNTALWNVIFSGVNVWKFCHMKTELLPSHVPSTLAEIIMPEIVSGLLMCMISIAVIQWVTQYHHLDMKAKYVGIETAAFQRLLTVFCDVQVHLGPDLGFQGPNTRLAQMLMAEELKQESCQALDKPAWPKFTDYLLEEDQERFRSFVQSSQPQLDGEEEYTGPAQMPATSLPVHMRDAAGNLLEVQLYLVNIKHANNESGHLIGIREEGTRKPVERSPANQDSMCGMGLSVPSLRQSHIGNRTPASVSSASDSSSTSFWGRRGRVQEIESIRVRFDPFGDRFSIAQCSVDFVAADHLDDSSKLPSLKDWIRNFRPFFDWATDHINFVCSSDDAFFPPIPWPGDTLQLRVPGLSKSTLLVDDVQLCVEETGDMANDDSSEDSAEISVTLKLHGFTVLRKSSRTHTGHAAKDVSLQPMNVIQE